ncbi:MAG: citrate lyase holo-[Erysipelotrichaceae bacterium]|nr:citrate lyase holo-[acyl-carrier protein] synthase [Erysipelotrichaceae bacterium]
MEGTPVTLEEILVHRERRVQKQKELLNLFNLPVITFTMNIAGPIKTNQMIRQAFNFGIEKLLDLLNKNHHEIIHVEKPCSDCGNQAFIVADGNAHDLKRLAVKIEEETKLGRLYDIDVIDINGEKVSRGSFRKCLICDQQAQICARQRKHSIEELQKATEDILTAFINFDDQNS